MGQAAIHSPSGENAEFLCEPWHIVLRNLPEKYQPHDIFVDRSGTWHMEGIPITPEKLSKKIDVFFNALRGPYLPNTWAATALVNAEAAYTGADALAGSLIANSALTNKILRSHGIKTPITFVVSREGNLQEKALELFRKISLPVVIRPIAGMSSEAGSIAATFAELEEGMRMALDHAKEISIEEKVSDRLAITAVMDNFRNKKTYSFLPVEFKRSRNGGLETQLGNFSEAEKAEMGRLSEKVHEMFGLKHFSETHFAVHPRRGVYVVGVRSLPELSPHSYFHTALSGVGVTLPQFLDHVLGLALQEK